MDALLLVGLCSAFVALLTVLAWLVDGNRPVEPWHPGDEPRWWGSGR